MTFSSNRHLALAFLFEHDLFGKPLHTFPDHALEQARAQVDAVSQHQQRHQKAGAAEHHKLLEGLGLVDGDEHARQRLCDGSHCDPVVRSG